MTQYGKIKHYDAKTGAGMIAPMRGGEVLPFDRDSFQQHAQEPRSDQLYTYETKMGANGEAVAINLQMEQGENARQQDASAHGNQGGFDQQGRSQNTANQEAASRPAVDQQTQTGNPEHEHMEGVSRTGRDQPLTEPDTNLGEGGSTFQPLESEQSKRDRSPERQHELGRDAEGRDERST